MAHLRFSIIFTLVLVSAPLSLAIKCRSDDGPSDEDLKRVVRSCMRKISESSGRSNQSQSESSYSNYGDWDYDDYDEYNRDDRIGNRDRLYTYMRAGRSKRSANDRRYDPTSNSGRNLSQGHKSNGSNNSSSGSNSSSYGDRQSRDIQREQDGACVVHCFFEELNMLNNDDYPDKHKVNYILTKDIRDRELRSFYTDAIQECFHYVEMKRRRDKCQFSKELINCMLEYARANCEDWQDHTLIFS